MRRVLVLLLLAACSAPAAAVPQQVELTEFRVGVEPRWRPGAVTVEVVNRGEFPHTLVVSEADGTVITATEVIDPGESQPLALHLPAGSYQFTCRIVVETPDGRVVDHYQQGMHAGVTVTG